MSRFFVRLRTLAFLACAGPVTPALLGCDARCGSLGTCHPDDDDTAGGDGDVGGGEAASCPEDPADGPAADACGIWVSSSLGDDDRPGTRSSPVATLARAIELAVSGRRRVYLCAETFTEAVILPRGVSLHGGFDCAHDWQHVAPRSGGAGPRARIEAGPDAIPLTLSGYGPGESLVTDLSIRAADAVAPGGSSIGVLADTGARATFRRCDITSGNGAPGAPGAHGGLEPAPTGVAGFKGTNACAADVGPGAPAAQITCDDGSTSVGGKGGDGGWQSATGGDDGEPAPLLNPALLGKGGEGETEVSKCAPGTEGAHGQPGDSGSGGKGTGRLTSKGFEGVPGEDGRRGSPGQGGGGGGGTIGKQPVCGPSKPGGGAGGGSGGAGGCGGAGGKGGGGGGASIGIATRSADITLGHLVEISTGNGGDGGVGGSAQLGGAGGPGGVGGTGMANLGGKIDTGCAGTAGGYGGNGGYGGGGAGGPSIGVAYAGSLPITLHGILLWLGEGGKGGKSGNPALVDGVGQDGIAAEIAPLEP